jgi:hypothetical protein
MSLASVLLVVVVFVVIGVGANVLAGFLRRGQAVPPRAGVARNDTVYVAAPASPVSAGRGAVPVVAPDVRRITKQSSAAADSSAGRIRPRGPDVPLRPLPELRPLDRQLALRAISPLAPLGARKARTDTWRS